MKRRFLCAIYCLLFVIIGSFSLSGCGVVPCAWVSLDMEGYVYYSSDMYANVRSHIYLYESKAVAEADSDDYMMTITFSTRILGADNMVDGIYTTTTVDISSPCSMYVNIYKNKAVFEENKKIYLNGVELVASDIYNDTNLRRYTFDNIALTRGNPNGQVNGVINMIEYKQYYQKKYSMALEVAMPFLCQDW